MRENGFTLVEVLVVITLIAVTLTFLLNFFIASSQYLRQSNHQLVANNLARLKIEVSLNQNYDDLSISTLESFSDEEYQNYQYQIVVQEIEDGLKKIIVIVKDLKKTRAKLVTLKAKEN